MLAIIDQKHNINNINLKLSFLQYSGAPAVFSKGKSLRVLQKACIKIVACAIYIYIFFSYIYILLFCWKIKIFLSKLDHRPLFNDIYCETILV